MQSTSNLLLTGQLVIVLRLILAVQIVYVQDIRGGTSRWSCAGHTRSNCEREY